MKKIYLLIYLLIPILYCNNIFAQYSSGKAQISNVTHEYTGESIAISYEIVNSE